MLRRTFSNLLLSAIALNFLPVRGKSETIEKMTFREFYNKHKNSYLKALETETESTKGKTFLFYKLTGVRASKMRWDTYELREVDGDKIACYRFVGNTKCSLIDGKYLVLEKGLAGFDIKFELV